MVPEFKDMSLTTLRTHFKLLLERPATWRDDSSPSNAVTNANIVASGSNNSGNITPGSAASAAGTGFRCTHGAPEVASPTPGQQQLSPGLLRASSGSGPGSSYPTWVYMLDGSEEVKAAAAAAPSSTPVGVFGPDSGIIRGYTGARKRQYHLRCLAPQSIPRVHEKHTYLPLFWYAMDDLRNVPVCPNNAYDVAYIKSLAQPASGSAKSTRTLELQKQHLYQYDNGCREMSWPMSLLMVCETLKTWERGFTLKCDSHQARAELVKVLQAKLEDPEIIQRYQQFM
jgi:hypothetical protein